MEEKRAIPPEEQAIYINTDDLAMIEFPQHEIDRMAAFFLRKKQEESNNDYL